MTETEAQELIAEINKITIKDAEDINVHPMCAFHTGEAIKKIITRFTNKPPYVIDLGDEWTCKLKLIIDVVEFGIFKPGNISGFKWNFTFEQLEQLRTNIDKMLAHLEHK